MVHIEFTVTRRHLTILVGVLLAGLLLAPGVAGASHTFEDVDDGNVFQDDIDWLAAAGVTKGCNPPANTMFCPGSPVTREQMAAFMQRLADGVVDAQTVQGLTAAELMTGAVGPQGPIGDTEPKGDTGPGVTGTYVVASTSATSHVVYGQVTIALCDDGDFLTGGGYYSVVGVANHMTELSSRSAATDCYPCPVARVVSFACRASEYCRHGERLSLWAGSVRNVQQATWLIASPTCAHTRPNSHIAVRTTAAVAER